MLKAILGTDSSSGAVDNATDGCGDCSSRNSNSNSNDISGSSSNNSHINSTNNRTVYNVNGAGSNCNYNLLTTTIRCNFCARQCPSNTTTATTVTTGITFSSSQSTTTLTQQPLTTNDYRIHNYNTNSNNNNSNNSQSAPPTTTHIKPSLQQTGFCLSCQEKYFGGICSSNSISNPISITTTNGTPGIVTSTYNNSTIGLVASVKTEKVEHKSHHSFVTRSYSKMSSHSSSSSSNSIRLNCTNSNNLITRNCKSVSPGSYSCNALNVDFTTYTATHQWSKMLECAEFVGAKRSKHTVVSYKDAMYVFGGDNGKTMLNDLIRFGVKDKSWGRACATGTPPAPRYHHSAVVYGNSMFIFGGYTGDIHSNSNLTNKNDLFEYEFQRAMWVEWKFSGKMPVPRSAHGAAVYDNKMWIYAGYDGNARLNDMWTLNLTGENHQWDEIEQTGERPPTCCNFPVAVARDCMYVFSGQSGMQITNSLFEFNFKTKSWRRIGNEHVLRGVASQPPSRRYGHTMVHHDRFLYVFGGSADSTLPNDLHCYDLDSQVWSIIQPEANSDVPSGRVFHASAVIGDAMYIFGGTVDNSVRRGDTYRFQFSSYPKCTLRDDFGKFYIEKQFCDIQFVVGPEEIKIMAHIAFVAARSKYLRTKILAAKKARFQQMAKIFGAIEKRLTAGTNATNSNSNIADIGVGGNQEPLLEVRLANANPEAFEIILNYIYTDRIDLKEPYTKNIIILITDIYQLAGLFLMPRLAHGCIQYLDFKINKQNVLEALYNADRKKTQIVKDHCMQFIVKEENYTDVVMSSEFSDLDKPLLVEIIRKRLNPCKIITDCNMEMNVGTTLESDMAVFLETAGKDFCDINLTLNGLVIPAHKSILSARTQYFQAMFRSFMPLDNTVNISIGDVLPSAEAFQSLLRYIYYGETKLSPQDALYLFQASNFYGLTNNRLNAFCKYSLEHNINYENVLETLEASDYTKITDIKDYALKLIVKDFSRVAHLTKMSQLSRELLLDIIHAVAESQAYFNIHIGLMDVKQIRLIQHQSMEQQQQPHHHRSQHYNLHPPKQQHQQQQNCLTP